VEQLIRFGGLATAQIHLHDLIKVANHNMKKRLKKIKTCSYVTPNFWVLFYHNTRLCIPGHLDLCFPCREIPLSYKNDLARIGSKRLVIRLL